MKRLRLAGLTPVAASLRLQKKTAKGNKTMAKLALVYGMRLFPADELGEVKEAFMTLKNGRKARIQMHLIEGSKEEIEKTLRRSLEAFFEMYPEI